MLSFVFENNWNPGARHPSTTLVVGTLITSALALLMGVPVAVAAAAVYERAGVAAVAGTADDPGGAARGRALGRLPGCGGCSGAEASPRRGVVLRIHSFVLIISSSTVTIPNCFIAGLVSTFMILPMERDQPRGHEHGPAGPQGGGARARSDPVGDGGTCGPPLLPLGDRRRRDARTGRAIGETIAVTILIGGSTPIVQNLFGQDNSLAAVIATRRSARPRERTAPPSSRAGWCCSS